MMRSVRNCTWLFEACTRRVYPARWRIAMIVRSGNSITISRPMYSAVHNPRPTALPPITAAQRKTLLAAALGWMLDSFDVMLYAIVLSDVMRDLHMTKGTAGLLNALT